MRYHRLCCCRLVQRYIGEGGSGKVVIDFKFSVYVFITMLVTEKCEFAESSLNKRLIFYMYNEIYWSLPVTEMKASNLTLNFN